MNLNFDALSIKELNEVIEQAQNAIESKRESEKESVRLELEAIAQERGYSIDELISSKGKAKKKSKLPVTHRDPENPSNTWTGRGRKPKWLTEALENGGTVEDYLV